MDEQDIWSLIRETRSARPGRAADDSVRGAVYGAALQQFQELMRAAETSGYSSRALPLFYAVSQAGRAVAAAWADDPWRLSGHGLKHVPAESPLLSTVKPEVGKADSFSRVAAATQQGTLTAPVQLGALWSSLPDLWEQDLRDERWRRPLLVHRGESPPHEQLLGDWARATVLLVAERAGRSRLLTLALTSPEFDAEFTAEISHYPTAEGWQRLRRQGMPALDRETEYGAAVEIEWRAQQPTFASHRQAFTEHVYEHRIRDRWWLRPALNDERDFLWPLMTWWALLFGLSMLTRYDPAAWMNALNVDEHAETVPLEKALDYALVAVPHFVYEALCRERHTYST